MPAPNSEFVQFTGATPSDLNSAVVALLNSVWNYFSSEVRVGEDFEPVGGHSSGLDVSSVVALTPPAGATKLLIQAVAQSVRYTLDGSDPAAAVGFQLKAADPPRLLRVTPSTVINVIQESATAVLQVQWGR